VSIALIAITVIILTVQTVIHNHGYKTTVTVRVHTIVAKINIATIATVTVKRIIDDFRIMGRERRR